jgi:PIN domain nuclease of toxin-antitoxin system
VRLLLDTHVALGLLAGWAAPPVTPFSRFLADPDTRACLSVASLWEIAIKTRLGKLDPGIPLDSVAGYFEAIGLDILAIEASHVVASVEPAPATRDPFDRLLLAQCHVENMKLATVDQALVDHPLSLKT